MHLLSNLTSIGFVSILFNAFQSHAHQQVLRGNKLRIPEPTSPEQLVGTNWQLKEIDGLPAVPELQTLFFETESTLSGYDGCNWFDETWGALSATAESDYIGSQMLPRPKISIIDYGSSTMRYCPLTPQQMKQQNQFISALHQAAVGFSLSADKQELTLYHAIGPSSDVPIVMTRIPIPAQPHEVLIGTTWLATDIYYSDPYSEKRSNRLIVLEDHPVTMSFGKDTFFGSTGTNKYAGDITMRKFNGVSMEFQVTNVAQTSIGFKDDQDPKLLQEHAWMDIIEAASDEVVTIPYTLFDERIGDTDEFTQVLQLGSSQAPLARFVPLPEGMALDEWGEPEPIRQIATPDYQDTPLIDSPFDDDHWPDAIVHLHDFTELAGSKWMATFIHGNHLSPNHDVSLFFASDTRIVGHGGCNDFDASWEMAFGIDIPPAFIVDHFVSSKMFCEGVIGQTEKDFFHILHRHPVVYDIDVDELTLWDTVIDKDGRKVLKNILAKFTNTNVSSWGGQSLVGMTGEEAKASIQAINRTLEVHIVPEGSMMTADYILNRVRIFVDKNGKVAREPQRG